MSIRRKMASAINIVRQRGLPVLWNAALVRYAQKRLPERCPNQPIFAQIEITTYCNLRCATCLGVYDQLAPGTRKPRHLSFDDFKRIVAQLPHVRWICLNGIGEPLLHPELLPMLRYLRQRSVRTSFFTNATLLRGTLADGLLECGVETINLSIDAADPATYESIRKGARMSQVMENIGSFSSRLRREGRSSPRLCVMTTVTRNNAHEIPKIVELVHSLGIEELKLKRMIPWTDVLKGDRVSAVELGSIARAQEVAAKLGLRLHVGPLLKSQMAAPERPREEGIPGCRWPWMGTYVTVDGTMTPCCNLFDPGEFAVGNLLQDGFQNVWNGPRLRGMRTRMRKALPEICQVACSVDDWNE